MTPGRKRKSSAPAGETSGSPTAAEGSGSALSSGKKPRRSRKSDAAQVISLDEGNVLDDPFSFDNKADSHPEPLKNISVERTPFGGMKFSRSPPTSSDRYASLERRATVSGTPSSSATRPLLGTNLKDEMSPSSHNSRSSTPKSRSTKKNAVNQPSDETFKLEEEESAKSTNPKTAATPASGKRKSRASELNEKASISNKEKEKKEDLYNVPELSAVEQLDVDHAFQEHQLLSAGARVLALWGREYYPAYICGRDGLSRYLVHFVEDDINRPLPPTGVIPLAALAPGQKVTYLTTVENEEIGKAAEIINMPSSEDANLWFEGRLELREENDEEAEESSETKMISWKKIILTKDQYASISKPMNKPVNLVDKENIVNESRSSRRSRTSRVSTGEFETSVVTPQTNARQPRASRTPKVPKLESPAQSEATPKSTGRRGRPKKSDSTETPKLVAKNTPQRSMPQIVEFDEGENPENDADATEEEKQAEVSQKEEAKVEASIEEQSTTPNQFPPEKKSGDVVGSEVEGDKSMTTQHLPEIVNGGQHELSTANDEQINGDSISAKQDSVNESQVDQTIASQNGAPSNEAEEVSVKDDSVVANSRTINDTKTVAGNVIAEVPKTTTQPASIFSSMKFVLTSATRTKKNSDFTKRDYRTKIEERGGEIIDDFSSLQEGAKAFLIADTYYRTHKYLSALSLSVPCVKHNWIQDCVTKETLLDHTPYMLPAGESTLEAGMTYNWKPLKGSLLQGKRVWVYSRSEPPKADERTLGFVDIWSSIIDNLGATLVKDAPSGFTEKLEYCRANPIDILLTDITCEEPLAEAVEAEGGQAVSSEWVIQAIVTGELPEVNSCDRFRFNSSG